MEINIEHCRIVTVQEAEEFGFVVEEPMAFLFDLGHTVAILGYNNLDGCWQFDTSVDDDGNNWQFVDANLHCALNKIRHIVKVCHVIFQSGMDKDTVLDAMEGIFSRS